uniref:Perforin-1-like n=1 Tax=Gopherus evgoodei TaxID=1825980 RepID=A0A8C4Y3Y3_9SAUR
MPKPSACILLLLLFLLPEVSPNCQTGTTSACMNATFVPGHNLVGHGIDVTTLSRTGAYLVDTSQWHGLNGTCTLCWNLLQGGQWQRLPQAVVDWRVHNLCQWQLSSSVQPSAMGMMESAASVVQNDWKVGLKVPVVPKVNVQVGLASSCSKLAKFIMQKSQKDKYAFVSQEVSCPYYRFRVSKKPPLTNHFTHVVKDLPSLYNKTSKLEYHHLIHTYGTHYVSQASLGGRVRDMTAVRVCQAVLDGFHEMYQKRHVEVEGGKNTAELLFSNNNIGAFSDWVKTLESLPGLLTHSLRPIHTLLGQDDPKREALGQAVSDYIAERVLQMDCTKSCPAGTQRSTLDPCSCICPGDSSTNTMCCSQQRGLARLTVTVEQANGLRGDPIGATDAYVKVFFAGREIQTGIIWNNNNPVWNIHMDFGTIHVTIASQFRVKVWDKDRWRDDLLGACNIPLKSEGSHHRECYLKHGRIWFRYTLPCGPNLQGQICSEYVPQPPQHSIIKGKEPFW